MHINVKMECLHVRKIEIYFLIYVFQNIRLVVIIYIPYITSKINKELQFHFSNQETKNKKIIKIKIF